MRRRLLLVISSLVAGVLAAIPSLYMGQEGQFVFWFLSFAFPFMVYLFDRETPPALLVLPGIVMGFVLSLLLMFQPITTLDALSGVIALPAISFLISWPGTLVIRCFQSRNNCK